MAFLKTLTMSVGRCRKWPAWPRDTCRINMKNICHELPDLDRSLNNVLLWSLLHLGFCCNLVHETGYLKKDKIHLSLYFIIINPFLSPATNVSIHDLHTIVLCHVFALHNFHITSNSWHTGTNRKYLSVLNHFTCNLFLWLVLS